MIKKILSTALLFSIIMGGISFDWGGGSDVASIAAASMENTVFKDISKHWAKDEIELAVQKGYVDGFPNGTFNPDAPVTRAQFIKMIVTALDLPHKPEGIVWYTTYVAAAKEAKIYQGDDDFAEWNMSKEINREHMAWLAVRAADDRLLTVESAGAKKKIVTDHYLTNNVNFTRSDEELLDYYHGFLMSEAFKKGILLGFGGNEIGLDRTTTRAQAVTVIERILSLRDGGKLQTDKYAIAESELKWLKTNVFAVAPQIFDDPGEIDGRKNSMKDKWLKENLILKNSKFHAEVHSIIMVDLADPNDPNRKLLPAMDKMKIGRKSETAKVPNDALVMIIDYEVYENLVPSQYNGILLLQFSGYDTNKNNNVLNRSKKLYADDEKYNHLNNNMYDGSLTPTGKHTVAYLIPNSGYTLEKRYTDRGKVINDNLGRQLLIDIYPSMNWGSNNDDVRARIFKGMTTHYD